MSTNELGKLLYAVTLNITGIEEFGVSFVALIAGEVTPPVAGARFDVPFEGIAAGPKLNGAVEGVDYVRVCADGRFELHRDYTWVNQLPVRGIGTIDLTKQVIQVAAYSA